MMNPTAMTDRAGIGIDNRRSNDDSRCISAIAISPVAVPAVNMPAVAMAPVAVPTVNMDVVTIAPTVMDPAVVTRTIVAMIR